MDTIRILGSTLLKLPLNETNTINAIAEKATIHWETTKRFIELIHFIQQRLPIIELRQADGAELVSIVSMPRIMKYPPEVRLMIRMYLQGIISPSTALPLEKHFLLEDEKETFGELVVAEYIIQTPKGYYLSPQGVTTVIGDIRDFYSGFVKTGPEPVSEVEETIRISPKASLSAVRARALLQPRQETKETEKEST
jgi:hypothetical protein